MISHLDCDHANGVGLVKDAKHILVSKDELIGSQKKDRKNRIRYQCKWWKDCNLECFDWNDSEGPFGKAFHRKREVVLHSNLTKFIDKFCKISSF